MSLPLRGEIQEAQLKKVPDVLDSDQLADRLSLIEQGHRPTAATSRSCPRIGKSSTSGVFLSPDARLASLSDNPKSTISAEYATGPRCSCDSQDWHRSGKLKFWPIEPECPRSV